MPIVSDESSAVTLGLIGIISGESAYAAHRERLSVGAGSVIPLINTERGTAPDEYRGIVGI